MIDDLFDSIGAEFDPEFENRGTIFTLIIWGVGVFLHIVYIFSGAYTSSSSLNLSLMAFIAYGFVFYFLTLPSHTFFKWDNLLVCIGLSFLSVFLPVGLAYIATYLPWVSLFIVFTPVWPVFILLYFSDENPIFRFIFGGYVLFWTFYFMLFFLANLPFFSIRPGIIPRINVMDAMVEYVWKPLGENAGLILKKAKDFIFMLSRRYDPFRLILKMPLDEFIDLQIQKSLGLDTPSVATENVTVGKKYGLEIENLDLPINKFPAGYAEKIEIFFDVQNYGVPEELEFLVGCYIPLGEKEIINGSVFNILTEENAICNIYDPERCLKDKLDKNDIGMYMCVFSVEELPEEKVKKGEVFEAILFLIHNTTIKNSLTYYIINYSELILLKRKEEDFFKSYKLDLPKMVYDPKKPYKFVGGFKAQPLVVDRLNLLEIKAEKQWTTSGRASKIDYITFNFTHPFEIRVTGEKPTTPVDYYSIDCSKVKCDFNSTDFVFPVIPQKISKNLVSLTLDISSSFIYQIEKKVSFSFEKSEDEKKEDKAETE
ncbi:MAG: hypothetical protein QW524_02295 [Candidatus Woesearchaeota archaeon]